MQLLIRATDLLDADDPRLPTALAWAARTATEQGDIERARALIDDAHRKALDQGDDLAIGFTQAWRASFLGTGRREEMARAVALLEKHPPGWQLASVLVGLAAMNMLEEHPQDALAIAERALPIVERHGGPGDLPLLLEARAWARSDTGDRGGIEDGRRALQLSLDTNDAHVPTSAVNLAGLQWIWDGPAAAVEMYEFAGREAARRRQSPATTERELAWVLVELGRWDDALALAEGCLVWAREHSEPEVLGMAAAAAAVVQVRRGRVDRAVETIEEALDAIRKSPEPQIRQPGLIASAEVRLVSGDPAAARRHLEELVAGRFSGIFTGLHLPSAVATAIAAGAADDRTQADRRLTGLQRPAGRRCGLRERPPAGGGGRPQRGARPAPAIESGHSPICRCRSNAPGRSRPPPAACPHSAVPPSPSRSRPRPWRSSSAWAARPPAPSRGSGSRARSSNVLRAAAERPQNAAGSDGTDPSISRRFAVSPVRHGRAPAVPVHSRRALRLVRD